MGTWENLKLAFTGKGIDHFARATLVSIPITLLLIIIFIGIGHADNLILSEWFLSLMPIPIFLNSKLSASTTLSKVIDLAPDKEIHKHYKYEWRGTIIGIVIALAVGIALMVRVAASSFLGILDAVIFVANCINTFGGLGSRMGRVLDTSERPDIERPAITLGGVLGLALSISMLAIGAAAAISVIGITSFITGGAAVPFWIGSAIFVMHVSSSTASVFDYGSRLISVLRGDPKFAPKKHEYRGSAVGVSVGLIIGLIVIIAIVLTNPVIFVGFVGAVAATLAIFTCMSMLGGLFSRIGRLMDKYALALADKMKTQETPAQNLTAETTLTAATSPAVVASKITTEHDTEGHDQAEILRMMQASKSTNKLTINTTDSTPSTHIKFDDEDDDENQVQTTPPASPSTATSKPLPPPTPGFKEYKKSPLISTRNLNTNSDRTVSKTAPKQEEVEANGENHDSDFTNN